MGRYAEILGCKVGSFPVTYLGLYAEGKLINWFGTQWWKEWKGNCLLGKLTICLWEEE